MTRSEIELRSYRPFLPKVQFLRESSGLVRIHIGAIEEID
jgi:hypothetical protein